MDGPTHKLNGEREALIESFFSLPFFSNYYYYYYYFVVIIIIIIIVVVMIITHYYNKHLHLHSITVLY